MLLLFRSPQQLETNCLRRSSQAYRWILSPSICMSLLMHDAFVRIFNSSFPLKIACVREVKRLNRESHHPRLSLALFINTISVNPILTQGHNHLAPSLGCYIHPSLFALFFQLLPLPLPSSLIVLAMQLRLHQCSCIFARIFSHTVSAVILVLW